MKNADHIYDDDGLASKMLELARTEPSREVAVLALLSAASLIARELEIGIEDFATSAREFITSTYEAFDPDAPETEGFISLSPQPRNRQ